MRLETAPRTIAVPFEGAPPAQSSSVEGAGVERGPPLVSVSRGVDGQQDEVGTRNNSLNENGNSSDSAREAAVSPSFVTQNTSDQSDSRRSTTGAAAGIENSTREAAASSSVAFRSTRDQSERPKIEDTSSPISYQKPPTTTANTLTTGTIPDAEGAGNGEIKTPSRE